MSKAVIPIGADHRGYVLKLGADFTPQDEALKILQTFSDTKFLGGKYAERRDALTALAGL